jgi:hypothetical protein
VQVILKAHVIKLGGIVYSFLLAKERVVERSKDRVKHTSDGSANS